MGLISWWKGKAARSPSPTPATSNGDALAKPGATAAAAAASSGQEVLGMNGAEEVRRRPADVTVFEFGSVAASGDKVTLAGYCPVSEDLEPCRWELLTAAGSDAPQFRIVF